MAFPRASISLSTGNSHPGSNNSRRRRAWPELIGDQTGHAQKVLMSIVAMIGAGKLPVSTWRGISQSTGADWLLVHQARG
jgi:hypothetical protein